MLVQLVAAVKGVADDNQVHEQPAHGQYAGQSIGNLRRQYNSTKPTSHTGICAALKTGVPLRVNRP
jgi:hypothetical protein